MAWEIAEQKGHCDGHRGFIFPKERYFENEHGNCYCVDCVKKYKLVSDDSQDAETPDKRNGD